MDNYRSFVDEVSKQFYVYHSDKSRNVYLNLGESVDGITLAYLVELYHKYNYGFELWVDSDSQFIEVTFYCDK